MQLTAFQEFSETKQRRVYTLITEFFVPLIGLAERRDRDCDRDRDGIEMEIEMEMRDEKWR